MPAQQAAFVAQRVLELREEGVNMNKMAVLYRSHFHALELQLELTRRNIPFSITSGIRFFEQAHIKDVTAFLKLVTNPRDEISFKRLVQLLPGIGGKGADKIVEKSINSEEHRTSNSRTSNIERREGEHPTANIQHRTSNCHGVARLCRRSCRKRRRWRGRNLRRRLRKWRRKDVRGNASK